MPVSYSNYLKLDELLDLQRPLSHEHDEVLFIIIHQVYELWFKEILHEADHLQNLLERNDSVAALHTFKRILTVLKIMVAQIDILETMTPLDFLSFRERLEAGSGFQSVQFREFEFLLGLKRHGALEHHGGDVQVRGRLESRYNARSLWDSFVHYLSANGYKVPARALERDLTKPLEPSEEIQEILIDIYRNDPTIANICERLVDLDEGLQEWRYRHVKMVERTIGTKLGTGGSAGAEYLKNTLFQPVFPDLWAIRSRL